MISWDEVVGKGNDQQTVSCYAIIYFSVLKIEEQQTVDIASSTYLDIGMYELVDKQIHNSILS